MSKLVGGDSIGFGASRVGAGIEGKPGSNVQPLFKNGNANPLDAPPSLRDPGLSYNRFAAKPNNTGTAKLKPTTAKAEAKANARGLKAANKDVVKPIMRRATEKMYGKNGSKVIVRGPVQVSKAKAAKINARNAAFRAGER